MHEKVRFRKQIKVASITVCSVKGPGECADGAKGSAFREVPLLHQAVGWGRSEPVQEWESAALSQSVDIFNQIIAKRQSLILSSSCQSTTVRMMREDVPCQSGNHAGAERRLADAKWALFHFLFLSLSFPSLLFFSSFSCRKNIRRKWVTRSI